VQKKRAADAALLNHFAVFVLGFLAAGFLAAAFGLASFVAFSFFGLGAGITVSSLRFLVMP
jgi:hypothetical protein